MNNPTKFTAFTRGLYARGTWAKIALLWAKLTGEGYATKVALRATAGTTAEYGIWITGEATAPVRAMTLAA